MRYLVCLIAIGCAAQVTPDPKLKFNRDTYHPVVEMMRERMVAVSDAQLDQLRKLPLEAIWAAVQRKGYTNSHHSGLKSTRPDERLVGRALTIRYLPPRPDLRETMDALAKSGDWPRGYNVRAAEEVKPGDVIVVDLGGLVGDGIFFGDISALGAQMAGAKGVVLWGGTRDMIELQAMKNFPVLAVGFDPRPASQIGVDWNVPVRVGNVTVMPGDIIVADAEAVIAFPTSIAAEVIAMAAQTMEQEEYERKLTREKKHKFRDVYPLSPELRKEYEQQRKSR
jgi:regulator of RNase E activity RraA